MAPGLTEVTPAPPHQLNDPPSKSSFPDGIRTSGQHAPTYSQLRPFEEFPTEIQGPTVWKAEDYVDHPNQWIHRFSSDEIAELSNAADGFLAAGHPLTGMSKHNFPLPRLSSYLQTIRSELLDGRGFILFKGLPVEEWGNHKSAVAYMGLGAYLGYFVSQNGRGHVLGHVKDLGDDAKQIDKVRIYRTNAR